MFWTLTDFKHSESLDKHLVYIKLSFELMQMFTVLQVVSCTVGVLNEKFVFTAH